MALSNMCVIRSNKSWGASSQNVGGGEGQHHVNSFLYVNFRKLFDARKSGPPPHLWHMEKSRTLYS